MAEIFLKVRADLKQMKKDISDMLKEKFKIGVEGEGTAGAGAGPAAGGGAAKQGKKALGLLGRILGALGILNLLANLKPITDALSLIANFVLLLFLTLSRLLHNVIGTIEEVFGTIGKIFSGETNIGELLLKFISGPITNFATWLAGFIAGPVADFALWLGSFVLGAITDFASWLGGFIGGVISDIGSWLSTFITKTIPDFAVWLAGFIKGAVTNFGDWLKTFITKTIPDFGKWLGTFITGAIVNFGDWVRDLFGTPIRDFGVWLKGLIGKVGGFVGRFFGGGGGGTETSVKDAIIRPDGSVIRTDPNDTLIATKNPEGARGGGGNTFIFNGVTPQEFIDTIKRELGVDIVRSGRF